MGIITLQTSDPNMMGPRLTTRQDEGHGGSCVTTYKLIKLPGHHVICQMLTGVSFAGLSQREWEDTLSQALATQQPPCPWERLLNQTPLLPVNSYSLLSAGVSESDAH